MARSFIFIIPIIVPIPGKTKLIKAHKSQPKNNRNKNIDALPEYIRDIYYKKLNYHN